MAKRTGFEEYLLKMQKKQIVDITMIVMRSTLSKNQTKIEMFH